MSNNTKILRYKEINLKSVTEFNELYKNAYDERNFSAAFEGKYLKDSEERMLDCKMSLEIEEPTAEDVLEFKRIYKRLPNDFALALSPKHKVGSKRGINYDNEFAEIIKTLCDALATKDACPKNFDITFDGNCQINDILQQLVTPLSSGYSPQGLQLHFVGAEVDPRAAALFFDSVWSGKWPKDLYLNFACANLGDTEAIDVIVAALESGACPEGLTLNLSSNGLTSQDKIRIINALKSGKAPINLSLDLSSANSDEENILDDDYVNTIVDVISSGKLPEGVMLNFSKANISHDNFLKLTQALMSPNCPEDITIDLTSTEMDQIKIDYVIKMFSSGKCPKTCGFFVEFNDEGIKALAEAIMSKGSQFPENLNLDLANSHFSMATYQLLLTALKSPNCPKNLSLVISNDYINGPANEDVRSQVAKDLIDTLTDIQQNTQQDTKETKIISVELTSPVSTFTASYIADSLRNNKQIVKFDFPFPQDPDTVRAGSSTDQEPSDTETDSDDDNNDNDHDSYNETYTLTKTDDCESPDSTDTNIPTEDYASNKNAISEKYRDADKEAESDGMSYNSKPEFDSDDLFSDDQFSEPDAHELENENKESKQHELNLLRDQIMGKIQKCCKRNKYMYECPDEAAFIEACSQRAGMSSKKTTPFYPSLKAAAAAAVQFNRAKLKRNTFVALQDEHEKLVVEVTKDIGEEIKTAMQSASQSALQSASNIPANEDFQSTPLNLFTNYLVKKRAQVFDKTEVSIEIKNKKSKTMHISEDIGDYLERLSYFKNRIAPEKDGTDTDIKVKKTDEHRAKDINNNNANA